MIGHAALVERMDSAYTRAAVAVCCCLAAL
jgi:hypothetical protein